MPQGELGPVNDPAGEFDSGISGGLGAEIVRAAVDDYGAADDVPDSKTVSQNGQKSSPFTGQQGRKVSRMVWMRGRGRIVVASGG